MKKDNSSINLALAIFLLVTSIMAVLGMVLTTLATIFIPSLDVIREITSKGDYVFFTLAWTLLHSYMIILSIEWLRGKSVKSDLSGTLTLMVAAGVWGIIRGPITAGIFSVVLYGLILNYIKKTDAEKLSTG